MSAHTRKEENSKNNYEFLKQLRKSIDKLHLIMIAMRFGKFCGDL